MKRISLFLSITFFFFTNISCKKEELPKINVELPEQGVKLSVNYKVDQSDLSFNQFKYFNEAGYQYSVTKLQYYLSDIYLLRDDGSKLFLLSYHYFDAAILETNSLVLKDLPEGNYKGLLMNIGLIPSLNISEQLPVTSENINMQWPVPMGGGYHFIKLEGQYKDSTGTHGFAMHTGGNSCLVPITLYHPIAIKYDSITPVELKMNINEWFRNPAVYDFNKDGNMIMGNGPLMLKFASNGTDVFSF